MTPKLRSPWNHEYEKRASHHYDYKGAHSADCSAGKRIASGLGRPATQHSIESPKFDMEVTKLVIFKRPFPGGSKASQAPPNREYRTSCGRMLPAMIAKSDGNRDRLAMLMQDICHMAALHGDCGSDGWRSAQRVLGESDHPSTGFARLPMV